MTTKKNAEPSPPTADAKPIALTLKVEHETYVRLSALRAAQRRTTQDVLSAALLEYLDKAKV